MRVSLSIVRGLFLLGLNAYLILLLKGERGNQHRGLACFPLAAGGRRVAVGEVAGGESQNPRVPFSFLFINRKSRQTGHYGET